MSRLCIARYPRNRERLIFTSSLSKVTHNYFYTSNWKQEMRESKKNLPWPKDLSNQLNEYWSPWSLGRNRISTNQAQKSYNFWNQRNKKTLESSVFYFLFFIFYFLKKFWFLSTAHFFTLQRFDFSHGSWVMTPFIGEILGSKQW